MERLGYSAPAMPQLKSGERLLLKLLERSKLAEAPTQIGGAELVGAWNDLLTATGRCLVAVDALDRIDEGGARARLDFLRALPEQTSALVTTVEPRDARRLQARGFTLVPLAPKPPDVAARIVQSMVAQRHRQLSTGVVGDLVVRPRSALWLRLAVDELAALGEEEFAASERRGEESPEPMLRRTARLFPDSETGLVERHISRAETRLGTEIVRSYLALHAVSRFGLAPSALKHVLKASDLQIAGLGRTLAPLLESSDPGGRLAFRSNVIRGAVERYTAPLQDASRRLLIAAIRATDIQSATSDLELLNQCLYVPDLAVDVLPGLFPHFPPAFDVTGKAQRLIIEVLLRQQPDDTALVALAVAIDRESHRRASASRAVKRLAGGYTQTGPELLRSVVSEAPSELEAATVDRLMELAVPLSSRTTPDSAV